VYLVGAGPGDPKLLTIRALEVFKIADVVLYDGLVSPEILDLLPVHAKKIDVGKYRHDGPCTDQLEINRLLVEESKGGNTVLRLKGGDPMLFSRGGEELEALNAEKIPWEVVPGVSAATGISSQLGIPLTHRKISSSVAFVTGHETPEKTESRVDFKQLASAVDTLVIFMGVAKLQQIAEKLVTAGAALSKSVAVIESGTTPREKIYFSSLGEILDGDLKGKVNSPALIVVGDVVRVAKELRREDGILGHEYDTLQRELIQSQATWCAATEYA
jgi:uroporphyrin-III C-methyltransferase